MRERSPGSSLASSSPAHNNISHESYVVEDEKEEVSLRSVSLNDFRFNRTVNTEESMDITTGMKLLLREILGKINANV